MNSNVTIIASPYEPAIENGQIVLCGDRIVEAGRAREARAAGGTEINGRGLFAAAGFWNAHVHLLGEEWRPTGQPAKLDSLFRERYLAHGFTTVVDLASGLANTVVLRNRINAAEITGPRILTTGEPVLGHGGTPGYARAFLASLGLNFPEVADPITATNRVGELADGGADGIKLFTGSPIGNGAVYTLPFNIAAAATSEARRRGMPTFAHPHDSSGARIALAAGVEVLAHAAPSSGSSWLDASVAGRALIPTLTLMRIEEGLDSLAGLSVQRTATEFVRAFRRMGGEVIFGTDAGYIPVYDPAEEIRAMIAAGMTPADVLASLTTVPSRYIVRDERTGLLKAGYSADVVLVEGDPRSDDRAYSSVVCTIRNSRVVFSRGRCGTLTQ